MLVAKNHQKIRSRYLVHEFSYPDFFNDINYGYRGAILKKQFFVAAYCYYEKVRRTMRTVIVWYVLKK